jgi:glycosyltransferase involved in cell wall biosynthesis
MEHGAWSKNSSQLTDVSSQWEPNPATEMSEHTTALLIPCYNAERYLGNLREQVDALNPAFDEVLLVDDGSEDGTVGKARALGFAIHPLGTNRGPGGARNALLEMTTAEWIHFLDADDEIAPDYLDKVRPLADVDTDVVLSTTLFVDEITRDLVIRWEFPDDEFRANALRATIMHPVPLHSSFIRKEVLGRIDGFDEKLRCWEDGDAHVRLAAIGARFRCIPDVLAWSPRHGRGAGGNSLYCWQCRLAFLKRYRSYVPRISPEDLCSESIRAATNLYGEGDRRSASEALDLAAELGWEGPESRHPALAALAKLPLKRLRKALFLMQAAKRQGKPRMNAD